MTFAKIDIQAYVICDEVRREVDRKLFLIGVIAGDIYVERFPETFSLVMHTEGEVTEAGEIMPRLRVEDNDGGILFRSEDHGPTIKADFKLGRFAMQVPATFEVHREVTLKFILGLE